MNLNFFGWRWLKTRLTLFTLLIFLISIWVLEIFASHMLRQDMQALLGQQQFSTVSVIADEINRELDGRIKALEFIASGVTPAMLSDTAALQKSIEERVILQRMFNAGVLIVRADGSTLAEIPLTAARIGRNDTEIDSIASVFKLAKPIIGRPVVDRILAAPVFSIAAPILNAQGSVIAAIVGVTNLSKTNFLDQISENRYGKTGGFLLIAPQYQLFVTATEKNRILQPVPAPGINLMHDKYMQGYQGYGIAYDSRGTEELTAAKQIPLAGWFIVSNLPAKEAFAPIRSMQQRMLLATLILTLLAGSLIWWLVSKVIKAQLSPVLSAAKTLAALSERQQPPHPLSIEREDEIGELIGSFNRLLESSAAREILLQQILDASSVAIFVIDREGRITKANQRMAEMFGRAVADLEGEKYLSLVHPSNRAIVEKKFSELFASDISSIDLDRLYWRADQSSFWGRLIGRRSSGKQDATMVGVIADISTRKQSELYERFRNQILESLAGSDTLTIILEGIVLGVEQINQDMLCSILLLDKKNQQLHTAAAPSLPDFYNQALNGLTIGQGVGCCGTAAYTGQRVIVQDIATHPDWIHYRELAARANLGACWSQPILASSGEVLGSFAIYHHEAHAPSEFDLALIEQSARLASLAIERKQAEEKLQLAASVFTHAREGIMITSVDGSIIDVNDAFSEITGYSRAEVQGENPRLLSSGRQSKEFYRTMWANLNAHGHCYGEVWNRRKNGEVYAEMQTISAVRDAQGNTTQYVALFSDITAFKEQQNRLEHIAHYDALTNLPNRVLLADRLRQGMTQAQRRNDLLAVVFVDLDGFKAINDGHGHTAGDQLLVSIAARMKHALRDGDTLARLGGDEFVAVLVDLPDAAASAAILSRLLAAAAQPVNFGDAVLQVSASIGVTLYPQATEVDADQLMRQADQAMYQAKLSGKNRYHLFDAAQDSQLRDHHERLERIQSALTENQFVLYYQPKVNMRSAAVIGAEALIRWQHPQLGLLAPAEFLPTIEVHPLAIRVGEWVIETALCQIELWQAQGLAIPVSVNIGAYQLQQTNFVARLRAILAAHPQVSPSSLKIEVLETSALEDVSGVSQVIQACRAMGVMFALDDFGTGYSSLTYLKNLPVSELKIDQSFVRDMLDDPDDLAILEGVIGLASAFRREVIAEGVETVEHGAMLLQLGCDLAQGYGIARPMPAAQFPAWAANWQPDASWNNLPALSREDLPLMFARVEHTAWIRQLGLYLKGEQDKAPEPDHRHCHFGRWLAADGKARHGKQAHYLLLDTVHKQIHKLGAELCKLHQDGNTQQALARLDELHALRDSLLKQLQNLIHDND
ncbi:EAL domain-containing protein [Undibacterium sp. Ren11W]|uniref:EAL domain-containing protein n=1 Tax=Undibacterium sp. Ren11W TaxID=3413045 RepID=UPI003BF22056